MHFYWFLAKHNNGCNQGQTFRVNPLHDWASHAADAFRYLAVGWRDRTRPQPPMGKTQGEYNPFGW